MTSRAIRDWAIGGREVSSRGRISAEAERAFHDAQAKKAEAKKAKAKTAPVKKTAATKTVVTKAAAEKTAMQKSVAASGE